MISQNSKSIILFLMIFSVVFFALPIIISFVKQRFLSRRRKSEIGTMLIFSTFLILSIWCLKYSVGYYSIVTEETHNLTKFEELFNSFFMTLRTFGVEEGYSEYIISLKAMFGAIFPKDGWFFSLTQSLAVIYVTVLNILAPVAGGAIIFEILASVFPKIKMGLSYIAFWRKKYYFSKLNEASFALANGIYKMSNSHFKRPVFIFSDAYIDDKDEKNAELLQEAKSIGAICIKDDISHVRKNRYGSRVFVLTDENESSNLKALGELSDKCNSVYLKKSEIFYVTNSDAYIETERRVHDKLIEDFKFKEEDVPTFVPVKSYRNLISNMLMEIPLFEPLIDKKDKDKLTVTILGTGNIGTEMFLTTYWIGQILNCTLHINIVSEETEDAFWDKIDYINPEIKHTVTADDPVLRINRKGDTASEYCKVNYICCDAKSSAFIERITNADTATSVLDTDYYFVSLGTDELNISVSNTIKNAVGKYHVSTKDAGQTVITYVVYDSTVSEILNRKTLFTFAGETSDILMRAVGSVDEVYSVKNVFMDEDEISAQKIHDSYLQAQGQKERAEIHKKRIKDDYKYWANIARKKHIKYKMFSMGVLYDSVFNFESVYDKKYEKSVEAAVEKYRMLVSGQIKFKNPEDREKHNALLHEMAWLEHRRWNAFTRVKGFRHTDDYDAYAVAGNFDSYKQMELKLHPCLVECDKKGIRAELNEIGEVITETTLCRKDKTDFDLLDDLSYDLYEKRYNDYDFKMYDYPIHTF